VVVSSGDDGWIHLAPHIAVALARAGYYVVGIDSREYLSAFTVGRQAVNPSDEPADLRTFVAVAAGSGRAKPIVVGISEGAGLSVLAATEPATKAAISGVVALGSPDVNELGWRWKDALVYITKGVPNEPTFSVADIIARMAPVPLAAIHSTGDEFVPVPVIRRVIARAQEPKKLWLLEACDWIRSLPAARGSGSAAAAPASR
jgi:type IV secretory pathway VirJ component